MRAWSYVLSIIVRSGTFTSFPGIGRCPNLKSVLCGPLRIFAISALKAISTQRPRRYAEDRREKLKVRHYPVSWLLAGMRFEELGVVAALGAGEQIRSLYQ